MRVALVFILLLLPISAEGQVERYDLVGGRLPPQELMSEGVYLPVAGEADTLLLYAQHVTVEEGPDRTAARAADVVVWCLPEMYPDPRHPLPDHRLIALSTETTRTDTTLIIRGK